MTTHFAVDHASNLKALYNMSLTVWWLPRAGSEALLLPSFAILSRFNFGETEN
jgi:hypothetical protein